MRSTAFLVFFFVRAYHRNFIRYVLGGYLISYLLMRSQIGSSEILFGLWVLVPVAIPVMFATSTLSRNTGWISSLPISKWRLIATTSVATFIIFLLAAIYAGVSSFFIKGFSETLALFNDSHGLTPKISLSALTVALYGIPALLVVVTMSVPGVGSAAQRLRQRRAKAAPAKVATTMGILLVGFFVLDHYGSEITWYLVISGALFWADYRNLKATFGMQPLERRRIQIAMSAFWIALCLVPISIIAVQARSADSSEALRAYSALPETLFPVPANRFPEFIAHVRDPEELKSILQRWSREVYRGKGIPFSLVSGVYLRPDFVAEAVPSTDWSDIPLEHVAIMGFYASNSLNRVGKSPSRRVGEWVLRPLRVEEITNLLRSSLPLVRLLTLKWLEYRSDSTLARQVVQAYSHPILGLSDADLQSERLSAAVTLSLMTGRDLRRTDLFDGKGEAILGENPIPPSIACAPCLDSKNTACSEVIYNFCLHQEAFVGRRSLEDSVFRGWQRRP